MLSGVSRRTTECGKDSLTSMPPTSGVDPGSTEAGIGPLPGGRLGQTA